MIIQINSVYWDFHNAILACVFHCRGGQRGKVVLRRVPNHLSLESENKDICDCKVPLSHILLKETSEIQATIISCFTPTMKALCYRLCHISSR